MGGGSQTSTTTVNKLENWEWNQDGFGWLGQYTFEAQGMGSNYDAYNTPYIVAPKDYARSYLSLAALEAWAPWGGAPPGRITTPTLYQNSNGVHLPFMAYKNRTYAELQSEELEAITLLAARGRAGDDIITYAQAYCDTILSGMWLDGSQNPAYVEGVTDKINALTLTAPIAAVGTPSLYYVGAPATDNLIASETLGYLAEIKARLLTVINGDNWSREQGYQHNVLAFALELAKQDVVFAENLRNAGLYYREWLQGDIENRYKFWFEYETGWVRRLDMAGNALRGLVGTVETTTTRSYRPSPWLGVIGGLATIAGGIATGGTSGLLMGLQGGLGTIGALGEL